MKPFTLSGAVRAELNEHIRQNPWYRFYQISFARHVLRWFARHWVLLIMSVVVLYGVAALIGRTEWLASHTQVLDNNLSDKLGGLNLSLLAAQAAIIGVVYPIVIGLITTLFQSDQMRRHRIAAYFGQSEVVPLGVSGLLMLASLAIQGIVQQYVSASEYLLLTILNIIWFSGNLIGTGYFLWTSRLFLMPEQGFELLLRHAATTSWPEEVSYLYAKQLWIASTDSQVALIPNGQGRGVVISTNPFFDKGTPAYERSFASAHALHDIWLPPLRLALHLWINRKGASAYTNDEPNTENEDDDVNNWESDKPLLLLPLLPGEICPSQSSPDHPTVLAKVSNTTATFTGEEETLIRWAYHFKRQSWHVPRRSATQTLDELAESTKFSMEKGEGAFDLSLDQLIDFHIFLIRLSVNHSDEQSPWSNLAMTLGDFLWGRDLNSKWYSVYRDILKSAADQIETRFYLFEGASYIANRLIGRMSSRIPDQMIIDLMRLVGALHYDLSKAWGREIDQSLGYAHGPHNSVIAPVSYDTSHVLALKRIIGYWGESLIWSLMERSSGPQVDDWLWRQRECSILSAHLQQTAHMIARSVWTGDQEGAYWMVDVLVRWTGSIESRLQARGLFVGRTKATLITTSTVKNMSRQEAVDTVASEEIDAFHQDFNTGVTNTALGNRWRDVTLLSTLVLVHWGHIEDDEDIIEVEGQPYPGNLALLTAHRLLAGMPYDARSTQYLGREAQLSWDTVWRSVFRIIASGEQWGTNYRAELDTFVESLFSIADEEWVSGRMYSSVGREGLTSLTGPLIIVLLSLLPDRHDGDLQILPNDWISLVSPDSGERLSRFFTEMISALETLDINSVHRSLGVVGLWRKTPELLKRQITQITTSLQSMIQIQEVDLREQIIAGQEDQDRLQTLAAAANQLAFSEECKIFPLGMFKTRDFDPVITDRFEDESFIISDYDKGALLSPPLSQPAVNEEEWLRETAKDWLAILVFRKILSDLKSGDVANFREIEIGNNPDEFWSALKSISGNMTKPVLVIPWQQPPTWLPQWTMQHRRNEEYTLPEDFRFIPDRTSNDPGRIGYIRVAGERREHSILLQRAGLPADKCYLFDGDALDRLSFKRQQNGLHLVPSFHPKADTPTIGKLRFQLQYEIQFSNLNGAMFDTAQDKTEN